LAELLIILQFQTSSLIFYHVACIAQINKTYYHPLTVP